MLICYLLSYVSYEGSTGVMQHVGKYCDGHSLAVAYSPVFPLIPEAMLPPKFGYTLNS